MKTKKDVDTFEVRPIGARALKSATDVLRPYLFEASVLDLFAGQGRFAFSTIKEGAQKITLVEISKRQTKELQLQLKKHLAKFPEQKLMGHVLEQDVFEFLKLRKQEQDTFDVIFADPPFPLWNEAFSKQLFSLVNEVMHFDSIFLVKYPSGMLPSFVNVFTPFKKSSFGESLLVYYRRP